MAGFFLSRGAFRSLLLRRGGSWWESVPRRPVFDWGRHERRARAHGIQRGHALKGIAPTLHGRQLTSCTHRTASRMIIEATARLRMIFERMMRHCCKCRIACTTQLLFLLFWAMMFITLSTVGPVPSGTTTCQLPMLCLALIAILNDGCILILRATTRTPCAARPSGTSVPPRLA